MVARALDRTPEVSVRTIASLVQFLINEHGEKVAREILAEGDVTLEQARAASGWISVAQESEIFNAARRLVGSDGAFMDANGYRAREALGAVAYLSWAARPAAMMDVAFRSMEFFSRVATGTVVSKGPGYLRARYTSKYREDRVFCLARMGAMRALPTIWGLDPARVKEISCIGWGDEACEYELTWREPVTHTLAVIGALAGGACVAAASLLLHWPTAMTWALPVFGAAIGHFADLRVRRAGELRENEELRNALAVLTREADEARREFAELNERQRAWLTRIETELDERAAGFQRALSKFAGREEESRGVVRAVSHDLASPIMVLRANVQFLQLAVESRETIDPVILEEQLAAIVRVERLLEELTRIGWTDQPHQSLSLDTLNVPALAERLGRRLQAFSLGRSLRVSVFATRSAPPSIRTDSAMFDRVLDNVFTNAVKYTPEGSIVVELGGTPGYLVLKVSDTGRGIEPEMMQTVFEAGGSNPERRAPGSRGIGLSLVVRLIERLHGRLEVMSRIGRGTTFWIYVPVDPTTAPSIGHDEVVRIRRVE